MWHKGAPFDHYVVVLPADQAIRVANTLANLGICLEGLVLEIPEGDPDGDGFLLRVTPKQISEAHGFMLDALQENWLGHNNPGLGT